MNNWIKSYQQYLEYQKRYSSHTIQSYLYEIMQFDDFLKKEQIAFDEIQYSIVRLYIIELHSNQMKNVTIRHRISVLRSFYHYLQQNKVMDWNPFELIVQPKTIKKIPDFLHYEEFEILVNSIQLDSPLDYRNRMILELLYATGIRVFEAVNIKLEDIDFDNCLILIKGKGNKQRYVVFNPICEYAIMEYLSEARNQLVKSQNKHTYLLVNHLGMPITTRGVRDILKRVSSSSPLNKPLHPHMLRHSFATGLIGEGADLRFVQEMMGHASLSSTQIYTHITTKQLKKIYQNSHPRQKKSFK